jgi:hypothetical protein
MLNNFNKICSDFVRTFKNSYGTIMYACRPMHSSKWFPTVYFPRYSTALCGVYLPAIQRNDSKLKVGDLNSSE